MFTNIVLHFHMGKICNYIYFRICIFMFFFLLLNYILYNIIYRWTR